MFMLNYIAIYKGYTLGGVVGLLNYFRQNEVQALVSWSLPNCYIFCC